MKRMKRLTDDEREKVAAVYPTILAKSQRLARRCPRWADEIESGAGLAAIRAVRSGLDLEMITRRFAENAPHRTSAAVHEHGFHLITGVDFEPRIDPSCEDIDEWKNAEVGVAFSQLTDKQAQVIEICCCRDVRPGQAGPILGKDKHYGRYHYGRGIKKLRAALCA